MTDDVTRPVVVIGAGAAGMMAAAFAAAGPRPVLLLERTRDGGRKILISGGGRCNVLPSRMSPTQFVTASSTNTLRKLLLSWPLVEQQRFFEKDLGIPLALEDASGKLFPRTNRARDVRDALLYRVQQRGVQTRFDTMVTDVGPVERDGWRVAVSGGPDIIASRVVIATGGLSVPATGSDGTGLRVLEQLGHTINDTYPALTPLTADPAPHADLAGISLHARLSTPVAGGRFETEGGFLFTHRGYSGPSVLNISHHAVRAHRLAAAAQPIHVQWTALDTAAWDTALRAGGTTHAGTLVRRMLPQRLADALLAEASVDPQRPLAELRRDERTRLVTVLARYPLPWTADEGYKKAEVTGGGVALGEIDPRTMQSRVHAGLYLCGEVLDAFGPIGGYNFAWAWSTGRAAGIGAAQE